MSDASRISMPVNCQLVWEQGSQVLEVIVDLMCQVSDIIAPLTLSGYASFHFGPHGKIKTGDLSLHFAEMSPSGFIDQRTRKQLLNPLCKSPLEGTGSL